MAMGKSERQPRGEYRWEGEGVQGLNSGPGVKTSGRLGKKWQVRKKESQERVASGKGREEYTLGKCLPNEWMNEASGPNSNPDLSHPRAYTFWSNIHIRYDRGRQTFKGPESKDFRFCGPIGKIEAKNIKTYLSSRGIKQNTTKTGWWPMASVCWPLCTALCYSL